MAMQLLDEKVFEIGAVAAAVLTGQVRGPVTYWDSVEEAWLDDPPVDVPLGDDVGISVRGQNTSAVVQIMKLEVAIYHPNGNIAGGPWEYYSMFPVNPLGVFLNTGPMVPSSMVVTTQSGIYLAKVQLFGEQA